MGAGRVPTGWSTPPPLPPREPTNWRRVGAVAGGWLALLGVAIGGTAILRNGQHDPDENRPTPPAVSVTTRTPIPTGKPLPVVSVPTDPRFATCKEAKAAGYGPYVEGQDPEYAWYRDADHDGIVCE